MRSRNAKLTVVAIVLLLGASRVNAEDAAKSPGESPFAKVPGFQTDATYSNYVGDDSELKAPPDVGAPPADEAVEKDVPAVKHGTSPKSGKRGGRESSVKDQEPERPCVFGPWVSFEYLSTWLQGRGLPPLVTTSPPGTEGVLPGAATLFGGDNVSGNRQVAGKLSLGAWLGPAERLGVGGSFFMVQTETVRFDAASDGSQVLARPIYETSPNADGGVGPASFLVTGPTVLGTTPFILSGDIHAATHTDVLGAEGYGRYLLYCTQGARLDLIGGYQFSRVDDSLQINHHTDFDPAIFAASADVQDLFSTVNKFNGGELGVLGEFGKGPIRLSVLAKVGLGNMNETVTIAGQSSVTDVGGGTAFYNGGVLALPTNIGVYEQDKFAVIPEADVKLIFKLTRHVEMSVGYNFIYWNTLALAGDQIDTSMLGLPTVNSSQWFGGQLDPAGGSHPGFAGIKESDLWLQGLSVGLTVRR